MALTVVTTAPLAARLLVAQIEATPMPLGDKITQAIAPNRFLVSSLSEAKATMRAFTINRKSPLIVAYFAQQWHQIIGFCLTVWMAYLFTLLTYATDAKVLPLDCTKDIVAAEINALPYQVTHSYPHRTSAL